MRHSSHRGDCDELKKFPLEISFNRFNYKV